MSQFVTVQLDDLLKLYNKGEWSRELLEIIAEHDDLIEKHEQQLDLLDHKESK